MPLVWEVFTARLIANPDPLTDQELMDQAATALESQKAAAQ